MSKIYYKSVEEIALIKESSLILSKTLGEIAKVIAPGATTASLNQLAETYIKDQGATPAFLNYSGFPFSLCISVNDQVVHGFPGDYVMQEGDLVSVDCGVIYPPALTGCLEPGAMLFRDRADADFGKRNLLNDLVVVSERLRFQ